MESAPLVFTPAIVAEDQARADFYALLSRLYTSAPDAPLLASIAAADELAVAAGDGSAANLAQAWVRLDRRERRDGPRSGVGRIPGIVRRGGQSEVSLHGSAYAKAAKGGPC